MSVKSQEFVPMTVTELLEEVASVDDTSMKVSKLHDYLHLFREEMRKIDAFKRELPLCMLLLQDAVEKLKDEEIRCKGKDGEQVEFMSSNDDSGENGGVKLARDCSEMKNWMSSAQLWSTDKNSDKKKHSPRHEEGDGVLTDNSTRNTELRGGSGAFVPFKERRSGSATIKEGKEVLPVGGLSLSIEVGSIDLNLRGNDSTSGFDLYQTKLQFHKQEQRKQRRCWSPELHRRFVNALQQLGGAQAATPKQIRELIQVDGLTNDEVKSHLQKYRLHIRKMPATPPSAASKSSNGSLMGQDRQKEAARKPHSAHQSGSSQGPLYLGMHGKVMSLTCGESIEDKQEEDDKSESHSWKCHVLRPVENNV